MKTIMSHEEFVAYAHNVHGLELKITRTKVIVSNKFFKDLPSLIVPTDYDNIARAKLDKLNLDASNGGLPSIRSCAKSNLIINGIKEIRFQTGLGLKESKDLYELNRDNWVSNS